MDIGRGALERGDWRGEVERTIMGGNVFGWGAEDGRGEAAILGRRSLFLVDDAMGVDCILKCHD